jgi:hypothetical protein
VAGVGRRPRPIADTGQCSRRSVSGPLVHIVVFVGLAASAGVRYARRYAGHDSVSISTAHADAFYIEARRGGCGEFPTKAASRHRNPELLT